MVVDYLNSEVIIAPIDTVLVARLMISAALIPDPFGGLDGTTTSQPGLPLSHWPPLWASGRQWP